MPFLVVQPPTDETRLAELGREIIAAAAALGGKLDTEPFLLSWLNGTRVVVERDAAGAIVGMGLVSVGRRWVQSDFAATLLFFNGSETLFEFIKQICSALGSSALYAETAQLSESPEKSTFEVTRFNLT
jgi:hypothetical protein